MSRELGDTWTAAGDAARVSLTAGLLFIVQVVTGVNLV